MEWKGKLNGKKGYLKYIFGGQSEINEGSQENVQGQSKNSKGSHGKGQAIWRRTGVFEIYYRNKSGDEVPDRREIINGLRGLIDFKDNITVVDKNDGVYTLEFYCKLPQHPSNEEMIAIEYYLSTIK